MSRRDPNALYDGFSVIQQGINSGIAACSLARTQLAWAVNTTFRNGYATHRPGIKKRDLRFVSKYYNTTQGAWVTLDPDTVVRSNFRDYIFQGAAAFERRNQLVALIGGHLFSIDADSYEVSDVSPITATTLDGDGKPTYTYDRGNRNLYRAWFTEAEDFMVVQDGQSAPWLYDGATTVRSDTFGIYDAKQVPVGQAMVYSGGRLNVVLAGAQQFVVGDIVGGDSGSQSYAFRDAVVYFTENDIVAGGGAFSVPINAGTINALRPVAQVDTSTGQGPTQVFTTNGIFSLNAPTDRAAWGATTFPLGTVSLVQAGSLSDRATVNVNGDIWFRSLDGIRSFMVARRDFSTSWVNAPMSREIERILNRDDRNLLGYSSAAVFDGRLLMTVQPYRRWGHGIVHRGLVAMDFAPLAFVSTRVPPVWEGIWSGVQVLQILSGTFKGVERCFIFALNDQYQIELWEVSKSDINDYADGINTPIQWTIETGSYTFPRNGQVGTPGEEFQSLDGGELFVDEIDGTVTFNIDYRADQDPCWRDWHDWSVCATTTTCGTQGSAACVTPSDYRKQYRQPFRLPVPAEDCDEVVNKPLNVGREFQVRLDMTGSCRIKRLELVAHDQQENVNDLCAEFEYCQSVACCDQDYFEYEVVSTYNDGDGTYYPTNTTGSGDSYVWPNASGSGDNPETGGVEDSGSDILIGESEYPEYPTEESYPAGYQDFQPKWTSPSNEYYPIGIEPASGDPVGGDPAVDSYTALESGVLDAWVQSVWDLWEQKKADEGITVSYEKMFWVWNESPGLPRFQANSVFGESVTWQKGTFSWELWIIYVAT